MTDQRCGTCRHYAPTRNPVTGRVLTSEAGHCEWTPPAWPVLSEAYAGFRWDGTHRAAWPTKHRMHPQDGTRCQTWEKK